uniref:BREX-1 system adenine-specific DNA-methyltransferase PglX n=1 Tax=Algoriphagus sp. TaxID=1872435 RepID=UPI0040486C57
MSLSQGARNKIKSFVQAAKKVLMSEFETQLQQFYGIRPNGTCLLVEELTSRDASVIETARLLRQRLHYLESTIASENKAPEAVRQLVREQAFTILNRFAALRMSEERNIIRESIRNGYNSEGFLVYDQLTGGAKTADQFTRYKWYVGHVFDELAIDLPAVFDRFSPYALLFPSERVLVDLLAIINDEELILYRETGHQPINLWREDETIGWIYQYYNSREEISEMRDASDAPRNSRELAVRNQFFTPRYVVQFLVDNSLGRQWFEMSKGQTVLKDLCQYMVQQSLEIFLEMGESIPETKVDGAHYVEFRVLKDPREILFLDPACGSMHFGLYGFDLFEQIYIEAWDNHPSLLRDLREQYLREEFIKQIPGFILRYNIHGVDIDPRAIQIAGLSLWLRAQKSFDVLNIQPADRPSISKSNLVIAEPLPGDKQLLSEFSKSLPGPIGKLARVIWDKMQLVGETGLLLKIEEELKKEIEIARQEYAQFKNSTTQASLFGSKEENKVAEMAAIYGKGQKISKDFFDTAEEEVLKALKSFAENAEGEDAFQKLLFAEDTARGFGFIELCRKRYDVIVMNPPFGAASKNTKNYVDLNYGYSKSDLAAVFIDRMIQILSLKGFVGCISTRTLFFLPTFDKWRDIQLDNVFVELFADFGDGVLDAMVETSSYIVQKSKSKNYSKSIFIRILLGNQLTKEIELKDAIDSIKRNECNSSIFLTSVKSIKNSINGTPFAYWIPESTLSAIKKLPPLEGNYGEVKVGLQTGDDFRYLRNYWEVINENKSKSIPGKWKFYSKTDFASPFFSPIVTVVNWQNDGYEIQNFFDEKGKLRSRPQNLAFYGKPGVSYLSRTARIVPFAVPKGCIPMAVRSQIYSLNEHISLPFTLCLSDFSSAFARIKGGKFANPMFQAGLIQGIPTPPIENLDLDEVFLELNTKFKQVQITFKGEEPYLEFSVPRVFLPSLKNIFDDKKFLSQNLENKIANLYGFNASETNSILKDLHEALSLRAVIDSDNDLTTKPEFAIVQYLLGVFFKRWNLDFVIDPLKCPKLPDIFEELPLQPLGSLTQPSNKSFFVFESATVTNDIKEIEKTIERISREKQSDIEKLLYSKFKDISSIISSKSFFEYHLKQYSMSKRVSPIYWPLSIKSEKLTIWLYYPKVNDGTIYEIVNEVVDPKIKEIAKEVEVLQFNGLANELNDRKEFLVELENFKDELLRVAQLPYKPNQDDGVLITAAPLHNLFRHPKWKKDTQDCWRKLEKGEYDWAHLAYSIWPDRVRAKCKKDLSMAIAHGLEEICEGKPKEKKVKEIKSASQLKLD